MQFTLRTFFLLFVVLWSSLAVFGTPGIIVFFVALGVTAVVNGRTRRLTGPVVLVLLFATGVVLLIPAVRNARESANRCNCQSNLFAVRYALLNYHQAYGRFPPAYLADKNGRPMHSWRVLILPFIEEGALYTKYNFNEPWDGPNNSKLLSQRPRIFECFSDDVSAQDGVTTNIVMVIGKDPFWAANGPIDPRGKQAAATPILVEIADSGVKWTEPRDFYLDDIRPDGASNGVKLSTRHCRPRALGDPETSGCGIEFLDGTYKYLPISACPPDKLKTWLSVGGYDEDAIAAIHPINWTEWTSLAVWLVSVGLLFHRAWRSRVAAMKSTAAGN
ncbi:MAG: DUF1559 domain-containing protein [Planctomycetaceae bacterium]|nr:DUF1559 domain-containing protein [Planctomycetaceae bacterium]